ncbi:MAG: hypothetical protein ACRDAX_02910, partial [Propionibacteriaceae bacterium]
MENLLALLQSAGQQSSNDNLLGAHFSMILNQQSENGDNHLHYLINQLNSDNFTEVSKMIRTMLVNGCNPNTLNSESESPFFLLLQKCLEIPIPSNLVEFFIEKSSIDFHSHNQSEINKMITELGPQHKITIENEMNLSFINTWKEPDIIQMFENIRQDEEKFANMTGKVLEEAIARDLDKVVDVLVRLVADVNEIPSNSRFNLPPAFLACALGHH